MLTCGSVINVGTTAFCPPTETPIEGVQVVLFHNFEQLPIARNEGVRSPIFSCAGHHWSLGVYPGGTDQTFGDGSIALRLFSESMSKIEVEFDLIAKRPKGEIFRKRTAQTIFEGGDKGEWSGYASRDEILEVLDNGALIIEVRIRPNPEYYSHCKSMPPDTFTENMSKIFLDESTADIGFKVKGRILRAHKVILKARAPDLLSFCDRYSITNPMPIDDVEPDIFELMLKRLYGMEITPIQWYENVTAIVSVTGKYGFGILKCEAEYWYISSLKITTDNVIKHLLQADGNNFVRLKEFAMNFIIENCEDVIASESYSRLFRSPSLMKEVMLAMSKQLNQNKKRKLGD